MRNGIIWTSIERVYARKRKMKNFKSRLIILSFIICGVLAVSSVVYSHCQIPCGIYDDETRFKLMAEDILTIEKSMQAINTLSAEPQKNMNQLVRWVNNKNEHADKLSETITYYFMAQRVKPVETTDATGYAQYVEKLTLLHKMLVTAMNAKQTTDLAETTKLSELLGKFKAAYFANNSDKAQETHKH